MPDIKLPTALEMVVQAKRQYVQERKTKTPIEAIRALASMQRRPQPILSTVTDDQHVLLIGQIRHSVVDVESAKADTDGDSYDPVSSALQCVHKGVDGLALFTDETVYYGGLDDLVLVARAVNVPVITQDYILDEYQVIEARAAGAAALVLSAAVLEPGLLRSLLSATQRNRMTAIVQVHSREELDHALTISPLVIGISNIDLQTQQHDIEITLQLRPIIPGHIRVMVMDGIRSADDLKRLAHLSFDAIMVEDVLLEAQPNVAALRTLLNGANA